MKSGTSPSQKALLATLRDHHIQTLAGPMKEWKKRKHIPPVLLFTGQSGIGKRQILFELAQWVNCEKNGFYSPAQIEVSGLFSCGTCTSCLKTESGNGTEITEISSDESSDDSGNENSWERSGSPSKHGSLKVDRFRELKTSAGFEVLANQFRIILIPNADRMTPQAANSVLKLLEEPPTGWLFFLTTNDASLLLPTLVSRCQTFRLKPIPQTLIQRLLELQEVQSESKRIACASLAQGSWSRARAFAEDPIWEKRQLIFDLIQKPAQSISPLMDWLTADAFHFDLFLDILEQILADLARWAQSEQPMDPEHYPWIQADQSKNLRAHARMAVNRLGSISNARSFWLEQAERCTQARSELLIPLNKKLLAQDLLFPWIKLQ